MKTTDHLYTMNRLVQTLTDRSRDLAKAELAVELAMEKLYEAQQSIDRYIAENYTLRGE